MCLPTQKGTFVPELIKDLLSQSTTSPLVSALQHKEGIVKADEAARITAAHEERAQIAQAFLDEAFGAHASEYRLGTSTQEVVEYRAGRAFDSQYFWAFPVYRGDATKTRVSVRVEDNCFHRNVPGFGTSRYLFNRALTPLQAARRLER